MLGGRRIAGRRAVVGAIYLTASGAAAASWAQILPDTAPPATSAALEEYSPDIAVFDGETTFGFTANRAFQPDEDFTIELWTATGWTVEPDHEPVILSSGDLEGPEFVLAIFAEKDGLSLWIDGAEFIAAHDFSNNKLHHIAMVWDGGELALVVNGDVLANFDTPPPDLQGAPLWIGSAGGEGFAYEGLIGQVRFWDAALDLESLRAFALADVSSSEDEHPYLDDLRAISAFDENTILIVESAIN